MEAGPGLGHNKPPLPTEVEVEAFLQAEYAEIVTRATDLLAAEHRFDTVGSDEQDGEATEFMVKVRTAWKAGDGSRAKEKSVYDVLAGQVHGFFKTKVLDPLEAMGVRINEAQKQYKVGMLMAAEEVQREELRKRKAAEVEAARIAEVARLAAKAKADEAAALEAAASRARNADRVAELTRQAEAARAAETAAAATAEETAITANAAAEQRAEAATALAAPAADKTRARGGRGGVSSLAEFTNFRDLDREKLGEVLPSNCPEWVPPGIIALLPFIPEPALETAVRGWIKANKAAADKAAGGGAQPIRGVVLYTDYQNRGRA